MATIIGPSKAQRELPNLGLLGWRGIDAEACLQIALRVLLGDNEACSLLGIHGISIGASDCASPCRALARFALANDCVFELCERIAWLRAENDLRAYDRLPTAKLFQILDECSELLHPKELASVLLLLVARTTWCSAIGDEDLTSSAESTRSAAQLGASPTTH